MQYNLVGMEKKEFDFCSALNNVKCVGFILT